MKKTVLIFCLIWNIAALSWADSSNYSATGSAVVNTLDQHGKDIVNTTNSDSSSMSTRVVIDKDDPTYRINPNETSMTNKIKIDYTPTDPHDLVPKSYIDALIKSLDDLIIVEQAEAEAAESPKFLKCEVRKYLLDCAYTCCEPGFALPVPTEADAISWMNSTYGCPAGYSAQVTYVGAGYSWFPRTGVEAAHCAEITGWHQADADYFVSCIKDGYTPASSGATAACVLGGPPPESVTDVSKDARCGYTYMLDKTCFMGDGCVDVLHMVSACAGHDPYSSCPAGYVQKLCDTVCLDPNAGGGCNLTKRGYTCTEF